MKGNIKIVRNVSSLAACNAVQKIETDTVGRILKQYVKCKPKDGILSSPEALLHVSFLYLHRQNQSNCFHCAWTNRTFVSQKSRGGQAFQKSNSLRKLFRWLYLLKKKFFEKTTVPSLLLLCLTFKCQVYLAGKYTNLGNFICSWKHLTFSN